MKTKIIILVVGLVFVFAFRQNKPTDSTKVPKIEKGMIKVSVLYPAGEGKTFDWEYYSKTHVPMVKSLLRDSIKAISIDKGISGRTPGSPATYVAMFHMYFENIAAYQNSLAPNAQKIRDDITNYTNIQPIIQI